MRRGPSTRWTPSACPRPAPTSGPAAPPAWARGAPAGCGTPAIGCVAHGEPDIARIDLAGPLLDLAAWGTDPEAFAWFEAPPAEAVAAARRLLQRLGALDGSALTPLGRRMQALPLPPRLARILIEAGGARDAARACAILSERQLAPARREATTCDLLGSLDAWASLPPHVHQVARQIEDLAAGLASAARRAQAFAEADLRRALFVGYADRLARRREAQGTTLVLATGTGAVLGRESGVRDGEFLVALDVQAPTRPGDPNALVRVASRVEPEWIVPTAIAVEHAFDPRTGRVRAWRRERFDRLMLAEHAQAPEPGRRGRGAGGGVAGAGARTRPTPAGSAASGSPASTIDLPGARAAGGGRRRVAGRHRSRARRRRTRWRASSIVSRRRTWSCRAGGATALAYEADGTVSASARLQELFGLAETPRVGPSGAPVVLSLLAPNGRPVQTTRDLRSFWDRTYPEVRRELRGRYPRHPWPEDPWTATPTARAKPRPRS